MRNYYRL